MERGVIFDMDGVLVDSYRAHWESWRLTAEEIGQSLSEQQFAATFGRTSREIIAAHWGAGLLSATEILAFDERKEHVYRELVELAFPAMEGAADLIRHLAAAGFRLAIGSSGPPENVALVIERLGVGDVLQTRVTGRDVSRGKPDPEVFLKAAEKLGLAPARCAVVEDAPVGITAANAAGMASIALVSTGHTRESVEHARLVVMSLRELSPESITRLIEVGTA
jgi:beta-phosphoglucomutase